MELREDGVSDLFRLIQGSAHHLPMLADQSVNMIATSPPFFGLRKYAGEQGVEWPAVTYSPMAGLPPLEVPAMRCELGLEPTIEAYIGHLVLCLREWWRVLRDDGTCWVNLGDSYTASGTGAAYESWNGNIGQTKDALPQQAHVNRRARTKEMGLKPKDLMLIPARFALAAQAEGWYIRSDIIWWKNNCMPESVKDRPTKAHEYIWLMAKSERYFYDADAIAERAKVGYNGSTFTEGKTREAREHLAAVGTKERTEHGTRNRRSVWNVNTRGFSAAHFAVWPPQLVEPMIRAGTSERGVCSQCGSQHERVVEKGEPIQQHWAPGTQEKIDEAQGRHGETSVFNTGHIRPNHTVGWQPTCTCEADTVPATVLDPFAGSGTTLRVAIRLGRKGVGVDISEEYLTTLVPDRLTVQMELIA